MLYERTFPVNNYFSINIPLVGEVLKDQEAYYGLLSACVATPFDLAVQLDDMGIDYDSISRYQLFTMLFSNVINECGHQDIPAFNLIFQGLEPRKLMFAQDLTTNSFVFVDKETKNVVIDEHIYLQLSAILRKVNHIEKRDVKPGNKEAKEYRLERNRKKQARAMRNKGRDTELEDNIVALVNNKEFKYDFESVRGLTIYQFYRSLEQVVTITNYHQVMSGYYAGTLDIQKVDQKLLNWLSNNK